MSVLIAGCIAIDEIRTPTQDHLEVVGGSASYAALSASYFGPVNLVGIVGSDFPRSYLDIFRARQINLAGLQIVEGKTFRWIGAYEANMNRRQTVRVEQNVLDEFRPSIPRRLQRSGPSCCSATCTRSSRFTFSIRYKIRDSSQPTPWTYGSRRPSLSCGDFCAGSISCYLTRPRPASSARKKTSSVQDVPSWDSGPNT